MLDTKRNLRVCGFFDFQAVLGQLTLLLSLSLRTNFQKSHKLSVRALRSAHPGEPRPFTNELLKHHATLQDSPRTRRAVRVRLLGEAVEVLPYLVLSSREVRRQGFALNRALCELEKVRTEAWDGGAAMAVSRSADELSEARRSAPSRTALRAMCCHSDELFRSPPISSLQD